MNTPSCFTFSVMSHSHTIGSLAMFSTIVRPGVMQQEHTTPSPTQCFTHHRQRVFSATKQTPSLSILWWFHLVSNWLKVFAFVFNKREKNKWITASSCTKLLPAVPQLVPQGKHSFYNHAAFSYYIDCMFKKKAKVLLAFPDNWKDTTNIDDCWKFLEF